MDGIFVINKPLGITSHDVVYKLRKILGEKRIGHGGTLDPLAEGVLPLFVGRATRLLEYALDGIKGYRAQILLGRQTSTGDREGKIIAESEIIEHSEEKIRRILTTFEGPREQIPPMYSALKIDGQKLYQLARKGLEVEREPRPIEIFSLQLVAYDIKTMTVDAVVSKGTYIRVLGEEIAAALGMVGSLQSLQRFRAGDFYLQDAYTLEEIATNPEACSLPLERAVASLPEILVNNHQGRRIAQGVATTIKNIKNNVCYSVRTTEGIFVGTALAVNGKLKAQKIINVPEEEKQQ